MIQRPKYLQKILPFIDTELIKVITGVRRSGKSFLLEAIKEKILETNPQAKTIELNFEELSIEHLKEYHLLNDYLTEKIEENLPTKTYIFLDEIQEVNGFERVINSLRATYQEKVDIYITGSNARLLSGELSTLIGGRFISFEVYPFTFDEYILAKKEQGVAISTEEHFQNYLTDGGMPFLATQNFSPNNKDNYLRDIYHSIVLKDIIERNEIRDSDLLKRIYRFIIGNVGRIFSTSSVVKYLKNESINTSVTTVNNYIGAGVDAYFLIPVRRYDLQGKKLLKTQEKLYTVDHGLRQALLGRNMQDIELILENIVLLELKSRGYEVTIGTTNNLEIDFIAERTCHNQLERIYIQVSYLLASDSTIEREFGSLKKVADNYPKFVLTMDPITRGNIDGIVHRKLIDWLLEIS
ncbi:MAG: ATP-binding protein [Streptococcaceae bacterium]|jgi:predicted AAA+ superfamily ATPase|nr:ATP-binding protein [Streptococcaceae bacterium]